MGMTAGLFFSSRTRCGVILSGLWLICLINAGRVSALEPSLPLETAALSAPAEARRGGMMNAGAGLPGGPAALLQNPALTRAYLRTQQARAAVGVGYGRGIVFGRHIVSTAASFLVNEDIAGAILYRFAQEARQQHRNSVAAALSWKMIDSSFENGAVCGGVSVRYAANRWDRSPLDTLSARRRTVVWSGMDTLSDTTTRYWSSTGDRSRFEDRTLSLDIGLFQKQAGQQVDFALVLHNALAYTWQEHSPGIDTLSHSSVDSVYDELAGRIERTHTTVDSVVYTKKKIDNRGWGDRYDRRLTAGMAYYNDIMDGNVTVTLPFDLSVAGMFDRTRQAHWYFKTGLETVISGMYCLRFGYARAPRIWPAGGKPENVNTFGGGGGVVLQKMRLDLYLYDDAWGVGLGLTL